MARRSAFAVAAVPLIRYYNFVRVDNISYAGFFLLSLALHLALLPLAWRRPSAANSLFEPISVSFLPAAKPAQPERSVIAPPLPSHRQRAPAKAKQIKSPPVVQKNPASAQPQLEIRDLPLPPQLASRADPTLGAPERPAVAEARPQNNQTAAKRGPAQGEASIFQKDSTAKAAGKEQLFPGLRDLTSYNRPIPLDTQDPVLAPFTKVIERWIESRWEYPDLAKHYGQQGRVTVEFTVLQNGEIDLLSVVRSSGYNLLDEEAVRAIKAAAPFPPIPRSIAANRLRIIAGFTYVNNRIVFTNNP
jgi:protein TonB